MNVRATTGRAAVGALVLLATGLGVGGTAEAESALGDWVASARAGAADLGISTTGGVIVDRIDPGGALAQSHVETATAQSESLASAPYPSEIGEQGPGLLYGVLQNILPYNGVPFPELPAAPAWPWTVRSSANGGAPPSAALGDNTSPFRLKTTAADRDAMASADAGGAQPGALSLMHMQAKTVVNLKEAGQAALSATSSVENLMIGDQLRIGKIRTELELTRAAGGEPVATVKRSITGLQIGGVAAEWTPEGFVFQGSKTPLPAPLLEGLKSAGIELEVGETVPVTGGVRAKGLTIRMPFDFTGMSDDQLPFSAPHTMTVEMSFGTVLGSITEIGGDVFVDDEPAAEPVASDPTEAPGTEMSRSLPAVRRAVRAATEAPASEPTEAPVTETYAPEVEAPAPVPAETAPLTVPAGFTGPEVRDEMGMLGWIAQGAAIAFVVVLVVGRARRVVGAR